MYGIYVSPFAVSHHSLNHILIITARNVLRVVLVVWGPMKIIVQPAHQDTTLQTVHAHRSVHQAHSKMTRITYAEHAAAIAGNALILNTASNVRPDITGSH